MNKRLLWSRILCIVGAGTIIIAPAAFFLLYWRYAWSNESGIDWVFWLMRALEFLPLFGSGLVALGAFLGKSRYRKFLYAALLLAICGVIALLGFFNAHSPWWLQYIRFAYPIGAIMSCVGAVLAIIESFRRSPIAQGSAHVT